MYVTHKLDMDLTGQAAMPRVSMVEQDQYVRKLEISLYCGEEPWRIPEDACAVVCYLRTDGTGGSYDALDDGTKAWAFAENVLTVEIAPQVLSASGPVMLAVDLLRGNARISTFTILLSVQEAIPEAFGDGNFLRLNGFLRVPETAVVGQYFRVLEVDEKGAVTKVETVDLPNIYQTVYEAVYEVLEEEKASGAFAGESAYEIAVRNGFEGTEEEWLESLQGKGFDSTILGDIQQINVTGKLSTDSAIIVNFNGTILQGVEEPTVDTDAATKAYVDREVTRILDLLGLN